MITHFSIRFTVVVVIAALAVSAASIPRPRGKGNGISIPLTKHSPSQNSNKSVDVDGIKSHAASYTTAKLLRGLENYERNTGATHPYAWKRSGSQNWNRDRAALDLTGHEHGIWWGTIYIGTPPQPFTVQIDTGTSDFFIPSSTGDAICKSHDNLFNPASSETAQDLGKTFRVNFGDGASVKGKQYNDNITIAGFTADKQTIGVATTYSAQLEKYHFPPDGTLGLGFPSISDYPTSTLLQTLVSEGKLSDGVFSLKLTPDGGEMYIGGVNKELYEGDITFVDVQTKGFWEVIVDDIRVNGIPVLRNVVAIVDTGANYIYGDPDRILKLHQAHGGKAFEDGWYTFPCNNFPDVTLTLGGKQFVIPAHELDYGVVEEGSPDCFSGIVGREVNDVSFWNIGTDFLQLFYNVFDMNSNPPRVGFAKLKGALEA